MRHTRLRGALVAAVVLAALATSHGLVGSTAFAIALQPSCSATVADAFDDDDGNIHEAAIDCLASKGIVQGRSDRVFEPKASVSRAQMASFVVGTMTASGHDFGEAPDQFPDDAASQAHEDNINRLAAAEVVQGYEDGTYRPQESITRDQMAAFLDRALTVVRGESLKSSSQHFPDIAGNLHSQHIDNLAAAGLVEGYADGTYRPHVAVSRDQMASFMARFLQFVETEDGGGGGPVPPTPPDGDGGGPVPPTPPDGDGGSHDDPGPRIDLRVLVIGRELAEGTPEPTLEAWQFALESEGLPYDVDFAGDGEPIVASQLADANHAKYQGVIVTTDAAWAALAADERQAVETLQTDFGVRKISTYVWPSPSYGLSGTPAGGSDIPEASLTPAGTAVFPHLQGPVPIDAWVWGYQGAVPDDPARFTSLVEASDGSTLMGIHHRADGREELVGTVDMNASTLHARLLQHGMLRWVTRGVHLGHYRNYLALHVDDILLGDDRWDTEADTTVIDGPDPIRMVPEDVSFARQWSENNGIRLDLVFNALGAGENDDEGALTSALLAEKDNPAFGWINHTFTHLNLDRVDEDTIVAEIAQNIDWAESVGLPIDAAELVTGEHSGLDNPAMAGALQRAGVTWVASDNSRESSQRQLGPALTVPRHPANLYYNVETRAEQLDEYNYVYFNGCEPIPGVHTCLDKPADWEQYVDSEATIMFGHVVGNDPRPHYLHQSNLAGTTLSGGPDGLGQGGTMYPVVGEVLDRYARLFDVPLVQPTQSQAGVLLRDAAAWQEALDTGRVTAYYQDGEVRIESDRAVRVPVTGTTAGDDYAGTRSGWIDVDGTATVAVLETPDFEPVAAAVSTDATTEDLDVPTLAPSPAPVSEAPLPLAPPQPLESALEGARPTGTDR